MNKASSSSTVASISETRNDRTPAADIAQQTARGRVMKRVALAPASTGDDRRLRTATEFLAGRLVRICAVAGLVALALFLMPKPAAAATCTSNATGTLWSSTTHWDAACGGLVPQTGDTVVIATATTLDTNTNSIASLTINTGITLTIGNNNTNRTVTVTGNVSVNGTGSIVTAGDGGNVFNIGGNLAVAGTFDANVGAADMDVTFNGTTQAISGAGATADFNNITINSGSTVTLTRTITVVGVTLNGTLVNSTGGTVTNSGTITVGATGTYEHAQNGGAIPTATWNAASTCKVTGVTSTAVAALDQSFGNFTWNSTGQTVSQSLPDNNSLSIAGNLQIDSTGAGASLLQLNDTPVTIPGNLVITGGNFRIADGTARTVNVTGNVSISGGTLTMSNGSAIGTLNVTGDFSHTAGTITETSTGSGLVVFNKAGTQIYTSGGTVSNTINFTVNSGSTLQMGTAATPAINTGGGTFTLSSGATLGVTSADGITTSACGTGATCGNIRSTTRTYTAGASYIYNGNVNQTAGTGLTAATPANLTIANTGGGGSNTVTLGATTTISGVVTLTSGILDVSGSNFGMTVGGNWTNNGGTFTPQAGTVTFNGTGAQTINGTATSQTFNNVTLTKTAGQLLNTGGSTTTLTFKDFTETTGNYTAPATQNITGNFVHTAGTYTAGTNTNFTGTTQSIGGATATTFSTLTIAGGSTTTGNTNPTITTFNVNNGGKYIHNVVAALPGTTRAFGATSTIEFQNNTANTCPVSASYGNLIINIASYSAAVGCSGNLSSIAGDFEVKNTNAQELRLVSTQTTAHSIGGNLIVDGGTLVLASGASGAGTPVVTVTGNTTISSGILDLGENAGGTPTLTLTGDFTQSGGTLRRTAGSSTINIAGSWSRSAGTFTNTGITVNFNGTAAQTIGGTASTAFSALTIANTGAGTTTMNTSGSVSGVLTLTKDLTVNDAQTTPAVLTQSGTSAGTGDVIGIVRRADLGVAVKAFGNPNVEITIVTGTITTMDVNLQKGAAPGNFGAAVKRSYSLEPDTSSGQTVSNATVKLHYLDSELNLNTATGLTLWRAVGSPTAVWTDQGATGITRTTSSDPNNWVQKTGVSAFSVWTLANPSQSAPTVVKLQSFTATRDRNEVMLQWQTGFEARNLGFNIYREENGQRTRVTPSLVAGSALKAGRQTVMGAGLTYTWYDQVGQEAAGKRQTAGGRRQEAEVGGQRSDVTYWLEDVDLNGTRTLHGPIAIADCGLLNADCKKLESAVAARRSSTLGELGNPKSEIRDSKSQTGVYFREWPQAFDDQQAALARVPGAGSSVEAEQVDDPEAPAVQRELTQLQIEALGGIKIAVTKSGWLRITQPELIAAGLDANTNARKLQLYANGRPVPIKQSGDGVRLTASDYIEFYGHGLESPTDATQTYYLVVGKGPEGSRIGVANPQAVPPPSGAQNFNYTVERKEREIYFSGLLNGDAENFFGQIVSTDPISETLPVSHLVAGGATLEISLQGVTAQGHDVRVRFNGTDIGTMNFASTDRPRQTFSVPAAALREGDNAVELTAQGGADDVSLVDTVRLTYTHANTADNNSLSIGINSQNTSRVGGFTNANVRVVDITDPANIIELTPAVSINSQPDGTYAVDIQLAGASPSNARTLLVFGDGQVLRPDEVKRNDPSSWASQRIGADYLIITSRDFKASVEPLAQLRRSQGMVVNVIDVEDLYDEFSFGAHTPRAIRDYIEGTQNSLKRQPHYVLFAGDASYDPKNYFGQGNTDFVPTKLIDTALMETASDDWFADFDGDGVADLAIGRLPVRSAADTGVMVSKIINYENMTPDPQQGAMLVADNTFEDESSSVGSLLPAAMPRQVINRSSADDATIRNQIISALNQGPVVANYFGHGSNGVWTGASLLSSPDAATLTNQNRLSLFLMMTCFNGYFQDPYNDSLAEALLRSQGGAVAVWASTSLTEPGGQTLIDQELYRQLFSNSPPKLGDAVRAAKQGTTDSDIRRTWTFFGDPAMRLKRAPPSPSPKPGKAPNR